MNDTKRKRLNREHPDCEEYTKKFNAIWDAYAELEKEEEAKYPDWGGKDHPADTVLRPARRKLSEDIKALQQEYAYLFTEDIPHDQDNS